MGLDIKILFKTVMVVLVTVQRLAGHEKTDGVD